MRLSSQLRMWGTPSTPQKVYVLFFNQFENVPLYMYMYEQIVFQKCATCNIRLLQKRMEYVDLNDECITCKLMPLKLCDH